MKYVVGDYGREETLRRVLVDADSVINLSYASVPSTSIEDPIQDILGNLQVAVRLFEIACDCAILKIIVISSGGTVYGPAEGLPLTEGHATNPISPLWCDKARHRKIRAYVSQIKGVASCHCPTSQCIR